MEQLAKRLGAIGFVLFLALGLASCSAALFAGPSFINSKEHDGETLAADLPEKDHIRNIGSHVDGAGMCVMSSIEMAARFQGLEDYRGLRDWCANEPGGAGPDKVDNQIARYSKQKGIIAASYVQYEGADVASILRVCNDTGRMACITYGRSPRYGGTIAHMTCCPKFGGKFAVCLDNNFPGENKYEWMDLDELVARVKHPGRSGWVFVWTPPAPPPPVHN